ncbi:LGFP repeat-containing protein [Prescottella equi]
MRSQQHALTVPADQLPELPAGQAPRSEREALPEGFSKEDADLAERMALALTANCQTYWPSPHAVCGAIRDKYNAMGGPASWLNYPTSPEYQNPGNTGARSEFLNGSIYWSAATGAHPVTLLFMTKWQHHGWEAGSLGYPTTDEIPNGDNIGSRQDFQKENAAIYWNSTIPTPGLAVIKGLIRAKWDTLGAHNAGSLLGYPTFDEIPLPDGQGHMSRFQRGTIYWSPTTGAHPVVGSILDQWSAAGYEQSSFGYPTASQVDQASNVKEQQFQNGRIYSSGISIPIGNTGTSLQFAFPSTGPLQAGALPNGVAFHGAGFDINVEVLPGGTAQVGIDLNTAQAPNNFRLMFAPPPGYTVQAQNGRAKILGPNGALVAAIGVPLAIDANNNLVQVNSTVTGNELNYQFSAPPAYPVKSFMQSVSKRVDKFWDLGVNERNTCEVNPYDCYRSRNVKDAADEAASAAFPNAAGTEDNKLDAARHCIWMGRTTEAANFDFAEDIGNAHESDWPGSVYAGRMDVYNNVTGRYVGLRHEGNPSNIDYWCIQYAQNAQIIPEPPAGMLNEEANDLIALRDP